MASDRAASLLAGGGSGGGGGLPGAVVGSIVPHGIQRTVFNRMFWVFTGLGLLVGTVVVGYLFWNAYRYRAGSSDDDADVARPTLGELPSSGEGGRHLLISFSISAILVVSLIAWSYGALLYLNDGARTDPSAGARQGMDVAVVGHQFYWEFTYHNVSGHDRSLTTRNELRVPADTRVGFQVTSADVFHTFGIPKLKVKSDAIPGQTTTTWLVARETGTYTARCYELCGVGHSYMTAKVIVMKPGAFDRWYAEQTAAKGGGTANGSASATGTATAPPDASVTATVNRTAAGTTATTNGTANGTATPTPTASANATTTATGAGA